MAWKSKTLAAFGAALLTTSAAGLAQTTTADPTLDTMPVEREDDDDGNWGWLGLLGLAGLLGLKKRDRDVDHRHTTTTTGGTNNRL